MHIFIFIACIYAAITCAITSVYDIYYNGSSLRWAINKILFGHMSVIYDWLLIYNIYTTVHIYAYMHIFMIMTTHNILFLLTNGIRTQ